MTELTLDCKIRVTEYGDCTAAAEVPGIVLIEYVGNGWPKKHLDYIMLRYLDYKKIAPNPARKRGRPMTNLLPENIPVDIRVTRYAVQYLRHYWNGNWCPEGEFEWDLNPRRYLQRGDFAHFYVGYADNDGYLRNLDGTIVPRKINCEFWAKNYYTAELAKVLREHPRFSDVEFDQNVCWASRSIVGPHKLRAKYDPLPGQLDEWAKRDRKYPLTDIGGSYGEIHDMPEIKLLKRPDDYEFQSSYVVDDDDDY